jgi:hypothetical protein
MHDNRDNNEMLKKLLGSTDSGGDASEKIRMAAESNPAVAQALGRLTESDIARISAILSDKKAIERIMSTPKAQALLKKFKS